MKVPGWLQGTRFCYTTSQSIKHSQIIELRILRLFLAGIMVVQGPSPRNIAFPLLATGMVNYVILYASLAWLCSKDYRNCRRLIMLPWMWNDKVSIQAEGAMTGDFKTESKHEKEISWLTGPKFRVLLDWAKTNFPDHSEKAGGPGPGCSPLEEILLTNMEINSFFSPWKCLKLCSLSMVTITKSNFTGGRKTIQDCNFATTCCKL